AGGEPHAFGRIDEGGLARQGLAAGPALAIEIGRDLLDQPHALAVKQVEPTRGQKPGGQHDGVGPYLVHMRSLLARYPVIIGEIVTRVTTGARGVTTRINAIGRPKKKKSRRMNGSRKLTG